MYIGKIAQFRHSCNSYYRGCKSGTLTIYKYTKKFLELKAVNNKQTVSSSISYSVDLVERVGLAGQPKPSLENTLNVNSVSKP